MRYRLLILSYLAVNSTHLTGHANLHEIDTTAGFGTNQAGLFNKYDRLEISGCSNNNSMMTNA